ncbi:hypothetical protein [Streptomyces sp. NRRL F-5630]|nr:hypothetical protein [Streptomyces sp. NRRL F-5630]
MGAFEAGGVLTPGPREAMGLSGFDAFRGIVAVVESEAHELPHVAGT